MRLKIMSVKYLKFEVSIHGIKSEDEVVIGYLKGWLKEATKGGISGNMKEFFNFRNEFESDIEIELVEKAGEFSIESDKDFIGVCQFCKEPIVDGGTRYSMVGRHLYHNNCLDEIREIYKNAIQK